MSQQLNLLLPELRPRFDWLGLPVVLGAAGLGLLVLFGLTQAQALQVVRLKGEEATLNGQLQNMQQQVQSLGRLLGNRQPNPALAPEIETEKAALGERRAVLAFVGQGDGPRQAGFAEILRGFARQRLEGSWLTGFGLSREGVEIRGRLLDPALLPAYINRLNGDPAFAGRRFAELEMKGVDPAAEKAANATGATGPAEAAAVRPPAAPYTEFALRSEQAPATEKTP